MSETPLEVYVDDLGGIMLGYPTSKLTFVTLRQDSSIDPANPTPGQAPALTVTMSTQALINACNTILANVRSNQDVLVAATQKAAEVLTASLVEPQTPPPQPKLTKPKKV